MIGAGVGHDAPHRRRLRDRRCDRRFLTAQGAAVVATTRRATVLAADRPFSTSRHRLKIGSRPPARARPASSRRSRALSPVPPIPPASAARQRDADAGAGRPAARARDPRAVSFHQSGVRRRARRTLPADAPHSPSANMAGRRRAAEAALLSHAARRAGRRSCGSRKSFLAACR